MNDHDLQFYATPPDIAKTMHSLLEVKGLPRVLEPSGAIGLSTKQATRSLVLPAMWKNYLIYGNSDALGLSGQAELDLINTLESWIESQGLDDCVKAHGKPYFSWSNDGPLQTPCNCLVYTFTLA